MFGFFKLVDASRGYEVITMHIDSIVRAYVFLYTRFVRKLANYYCCQLECSYFSPRLHVLACRHCAYLFAVIIICLLSLCNAQYTKLDVLFGRSAITHPQQHTRERWYSHVHVFEPQRIEYRMIDSESYTIRSVCGWMNFVH